jgi:hypothetical protein
VRWRIAFSPKDSCGTPDRSDYQRSNAPIIVSIAPSSHPLITLPTPISVSKGSPLRFERRRSGVLGKYTLLTDPDWSGTLYRREVCRHSGWSLYLDRWAIAKGEHDLWKETHTAGLRKRCAISRWKSLDSDSLEKNQMIFSTERGTRHGRRSWRLRTIIRESRPDCIYTRVPSRGSCRSILPPSIRITSTSIA